MNIGEWSCSSFWSGFFSPSAMIAGGIRRDGWSTMSKFGADLKSFVLPIVDVVDYFCRFPEKQKIEIFL
jgi:hypothetical protein